jgi:hypothetical protein
MMMLVLQVALHQVTISRHLCGETDCTQAKEFAQIYDGKLNHPVDWP